MVHQDRDSAKIELEVAALIFSVLLVMISILTTMPTDVLGVLKNMTMTTTYSPPEAWPPMTIITITPAPITVSEAILRSLVALLVTIPLYLLYLSSRKAYVLIFARTALIASAYFVIPLLMVFTGMFMFRLIGNEAASLINPTLEIVANADLFITLFWIGAIWYRGRMLLPFLKRYFHKPPNEDHDVSGLYE